MGQGVSYRRQRARPSGKEDRCSTCTERQSRGKLKFPLKFHTKVKTKESFSELEEKIFRCCEQGDFKSVVRILHKFRDLDINRQIKIGSNSAILKSLNETDVEKTSAMYIACKHAHIDIIRELLKYPKIDANIGKTRISTLYVYYTETETRISPLYIACEMGHVHVVKEFVNCNKVDINLGFRFGPYMTKNRSPLERAAEFGFVSIIKLLLSRGDIDVETKSLLEIAKNEETRKVLRLYGQTWSKDNHLMYPLGFRKVIFTLLLVNSRNDSEFGVISKDVLMFVIFAFMNPFGLYFD